MAVKITIEIAPASETRCGLCRLVVPGPRWDYCGAFGRPLEYVGNDDGAYKRIPACAQQAIETK